MKVNETYLWISTADLRVIFRCDFQRAWVRLDVETESDQKSRQLMGQLQNEIRLTPSDPNPYKYRKTSGTYEIKTWERAAFGDAVEQALNSVTKSKIPVERLAIREAYAQKKMPMM